MSNGVKTARRFAMAALGVIAFLGGSLVSLAGVSTPVSAVVGTNEQINFQGRLFNAQGAVVPDGFYNIQFKIYQDGDGQSVGNTTGSPAGSLRWTESFLNVNSKGVQVKNGYMSVELGSVNPFGTQVDWNQSTLWLSMNIGSTNASCASFGACSPDGEMTPMKRLSSSVYAMNANKLGGLTSAGFIQNTTSLQTANIAVQSVNSTSIGAVIQGANSQTSDLLQLKANGVATPLLAVSASGQVGIQSTATSGQALTIKSSFGNNALTVDAENLRFGFGLTGSNLPTLSGRGIQVQGAIRLSGGGSSTLVDDYTTPVGSVVKTKISIEAYDPGAFGQIIAMGLPSTANATSRVMSLLDARTGAHQPTITVFSPDENQVFGFSWDGSNTVALVKNSANVTAVNNNGVNVLTTRNTGGVSSVGIGNDASSGYALDVTGDINSSTQYRIGGQTALSSSTLSFNAASAASIQSAAGQTLNVSGGTATGINTNGGNLQLSGGGGTGSGVTGLVVLNTPTYSTASLQTSATNVNITQSNLDSFGTVILNASTTNVNYTMGSPTLGASAAGRLLYVTAANGSADFTLRANVGGGIGVEQNIAMRQNTTATMIWSGTQWTAAGASSSTTLQAAYDNTLTSAGGAELLLSNGANANGLTIRDSSTNAVNGTLLEVQNSSAANLFSVNSNVTEYASNAGAETAGGTSTTFPASTWSALTGATVSRYVTAGNYVATGQASTSVVTTATANAGLDNQLVNSAGAAAALTANTTYNVSFATRLLSGTFTDMYVQYSMDGTTTAGSLTSCTTGATAATSVWSKVNCTFTTPTTGITSANGIFIRQTGATARTFYVDNLSVTIAADYNFATDGNVSDNTNFATNWSYSTGTGTGVVSRNTSDGYNASDSAQVAISAGAVNAGVRNKLRSNPLPSTLYRMTVYAKLSSGTFNDFKVRYSRDGGTSFVDCVDYNTQAVTTTAWTKITCYVTTDGTAASNPYVYFAESTATARTYTVDAFSMTLRSSTTPNVQIGGGVNGGPTTLLTLDKGASAPIASDNDALLGSMYYDTTLGKLQCYEADGWGACGSSPDNVVTISPEYTNAVMHGTGVGTMTSDFCSSAAGININDGTSSQPTICGANETFNFYKWTSPQSTSQTYSIYVTYQLPGTFKEFASGQTSLGGRISSTTNSNVSYQVYRSNPTTGLTACSSPVGINTASANTWQTLIATGAADPSTCGFLPSDSIVFKINMSANNTANAYVSNLNFTFSNR